MPTHKYQAGQEVRFRPHLLQTGSSQQPYVIVRLLPEEGCSPQYRIKAKAGGVERVVGEGQISLYDDLLQRTEGHAAGARPKPPTK
jgi:hypothetical protein